MKVDAEYREVAKVAYRQRDVAVSTGFVKPILR